MAKINALVCDECGEQLSKFKCINCGKDLCLRCVNFIELGNYSETGIKIFTGKDPESKKSICENCARKLFSIPNKDKSELIKENIFKVLQEINIEENI